MRLILPETIQIITRTKRLRLFADVCMFIRRILLLADTHAVVEFYMEVVSIVHAPITALHALHAVQRLNETQRVEETHAQI